jgi:hypothetical protein
MILEIDTEKKTIKVFDPFTVGGLYDTLDEFGSNWSGYTVVSGVQLLSYSPSNTINPFPPMDMTKNWKDNTGGVPFSYPTFSSRVIQDVPNFEGPIDGDVSIGKADGYTDTQVPHKKQRH